MPLPGTSEALRLYQWGPQIVQAKVTLSMPTKPTAAETITLGAYVYTWRAAAAAPGEVTIGAAVANSQANLIAAINVGDTFNPRHPLVRISPFNTGNDSVLFARVGGVAGNVIASTETMVAVGNVFSSATLLGGSGDQDTPVAGTSKIITQLIDFEPKDLVYRPELAKGVLIGNRGNEQVIMRGTKWSMPDSPMMYEQLINWLSMWCTNYTYVVIGGVANWVFEWLVDGSPEPLPWTFQRGLSDGTNLIDNSFGFGMLEKWAFKSAQDKAIMMSANGFARRIQTTARTAGLLMPTPEIPASAQLTLFVDNDWASLGGTTISKQMYQSDHTFETGYEPLPTSPGRSDLDFGQFLPNSKMMKNTASFLALVTNGGLYATEKTAAEAQAVRAVRLQIDGTGGRQILVDRIMKYKEGSVFKVQTLNGTDAVKLDLESSYDDLSHYMRWTVKVPGVAAIG